MKMKVLKMFIPVLGFIILLVELSEFYIEVMNRFNSKREHRRIGFRMLGVILLAILLFVAIVLLFIILHQLIFDGADMNSFFRLITVFVSSVVSNGIFILDEVLLKKKIRKIDNEKLISENQDELQ
ncbi:MAG: hypothetical protein FWE02_02865 [Defluviitaleaceae bacterium]|nr:hypothetical protein [Defluviitaleaceae bacterium]